MDEIERLLAQQVRMLETAMAATGATRRAPDSTDAAEIFDRLVVLRAVLTVLATGQATVQDPEALAAARERLGEDNPVCRHLDKALTFAGYA